MSNLKNGKKEKKLTGKHFLLYILSFFGVIIGMNLVFVYFATNTWTGLSKDNAYIDGLNYNKTIEAAQAQEALKWQSQLSLTPVGDQYLLVFVLEDKDIQALSGFTVTAKIGRPTLQDYDQTLILAESQAGNYETTFDLPLNGQWQVSLNAISPDGIPYQIEQRFFMK
ncbi:FixH family protein [Kiloniella antarctica]|uniref:FixH family protein n=1 Tax=Kiloniella antarctica TaxID=1550907 RepID=A0ABW5BRL5_9PROT